LRGFALRGDSFLQEVDAGLVSGATYGDWVKKQTKPLPPTSSSEYATLFQQWTVAKKEHKGTPLVKNAVTDKEKSLLATWQSIHSKFERLLKTTPDVKPFLPKLGYLPRKGKSKAARYAAVPPPKKGVKAQPPVPSLPGGTEGVLTTLLKVWKEDLLPVLTDVAGLIRALRTP